MENDLFIDDLPLKIVIFYSYMSLPEGNSPLVNREALSENSDN
jgi:hypothetical protein